MNRFPSPSIRAHNEQMEGTYADKIWKKTANCMIFRGINGRLKSYPSGFGGDDGLEGDDLGCYVGDDAYGEAEGTDAVQHGEEEPGDIHKGLSACPVVLPMDTVSALFSIREWMEKMDKVGGERICILDHASYKMPGGQYLKGVPSQEESLCRHSFLYQVLSSQQAFYAKNMRQVKKGLYTDAAIYVPGVTFEHDGRQMTADVLACSAPNLARAEQYGVQASRHRDILVSRMRFLRSIMEHYHVDTAILGAWGCGVLGQDPLNIASCFEEVFSSSSIQRVYAVPPRPADRNYQAFRDTIKRAKETGARCDRAEWHG